MQRLLRYFDRRQWAMIAASIAFIVVQVWLDLKLPDYMSAITTLVQTEGSAMADILTQGGYMLLCALGSGVADPVPEDAPFYVKDYHDYYKTERGYHPRSLNSNGGWNVTGCMSFMNQPILKYTNEIRSAVLIIHGEKAHSCYFSRAAYADMVKDNPYTDNKELMIIPDAVHTDLYDKMDVIPFDRMEEFFRKAME